MSKGFILRSCLLFALVILVVSMVIPSASACTQPRIEEPDCRKDCGSGILRVCSPSGKPCTSIGVCSVTQIYWADYKEKTLTIWVNITLTATRKHVYNVLFDIATNMKPTDNFGTIVVQKYSKYGDTGSLLATYYYKPSDFAKGDWAPAYGPPYGGFYGGGRPSLVWVLPAKSKPSTWSPHMVSANLYSKGYGKPDVIWLKIMIPISQNVNPKLEFYFHASAKSSPCSCDYTVFTPFSEYTLITYLLTPPHVPEFADGIIPALATSFGAYAFIKKKSFHKKN